MSPDRLPVSIRLAHQDDKPAMLELTRTIWNGGDYVPYVWDEWLADPHGCLLVAENAGQMLGLGKLTRLSDEDWWMEGLRVDPQFEGRGVASQLHAALLQAWLQTGGGVLRLATSAKRIPVHHLCARTGFTRLAEYRFYTAPATSASEPAGWPFQTLDLAEIDSATAFARASPTLALSAGLCDLGWQYAPPRPEFIASAIQQGRAWWWRQRLGLLTTRIEDDPDEPPTLVAQFIACPLPDLPALLLDFTRLAASLDLPNAGWLATSEPQIQAALQSAGYQTDWEHAAMLIFARPA